METIFKAIVPGWTGTGLPREFPWHVRFALRASVLVAHIFAIFQYGLPFNRINAEKKQAIIHKIYSHSNPNIRSIFELWKTMAFMTQC